MKREIATMERVAAGVLSCLHTADEYGFKCGAHKRAIAMFFDVIKVDVGAVELAADYLRGKGYDIEDTGKCLRLISEPKP